ncbi:hypothetical protein CHS0354_014552 [Potamilus streckersoni]|uniref:Uncharacterized protein n=1 Tax=Potamilus streckersoni TaxID=2493646 RepID=A0AAE0RQX9_9BIVA|nr:hypothetical protein CHS0354_014552 [Potamilus streckersoni]
MKDIILDIYSEYNLSPCTCDSPEHHKEIPCKQFAIPVRPHFASDKGYICSEKLEKQISLSFGGNDFIPKFYEISHEKWLKGIFVNETFMKGLFKIHSRSGYGHLSVTINPKGLHKSDEERLLP